MVKTSDSLCGNILLKNAGSEEYLAMDVNNARTLAAELQNSGAEVCGMCVATLYADEK